jgi:hypothetical protein
MKRDLQRGLAICFAYSPLPAFFSDLGSITGFLTSAQMIGLSRFAGGTIV